MKVFIYLPDGVGLKNFAFTKFYEIGKNLNHKIIYWNNTVFPLKKEFGYEELNLPNGRINQVSDLYKRAKIRIELKLNYKETKDKAYLGGAISPGLTMRLQSLHTFTDQLPLIKPNREKKEFFLMGKTTEESIESGVFNGTFAEIEGIIARYKEIYKDLTVILTGGDQKIFDKNLKSDIFAISNLQAVGLNRILNYNAEI